MNRCLKEIALSAAAKKMEMVLLTPSGFDEAKLIAREIAERDGQDADVVFADAMHVAVALALETEDRPYSKANAAQMFDQIFPEEVLELLTVRRDDPETYETLPMALMTEGLTSV